MNKRIVYTRPDGGLSVLIPAPGFLAKFATDEEGLAALVAKDVPPDASDVCQCDASEIPEDRTFREAWKRGLKPVEVDMLKAREIYMARIRAARNAKLQEMDNETARLDGLRKLGEATDADLMAHEQEKQHLRDIPQKLNLSQARTPEELKALWPSDLPKPPV
jgi:hypothetical protein